MSRCAALVLVTTLIGCDGGAGAPTPFDAAAVDEAAVEAGGGVVLGSDGTDAGTPGEGMPPEAGPCTPPATSPVPATTGAKCIPGGPGAIGCPGAVTDGWIYNCTVAGDGGFLAPTGAGACTSFGQTQYDDAAVGVVLCALPACTQAASGCDGGTAFACPSHYADSGVSAPSGCAAAGIIYGAEGLPADLYCCP
jgi:hypothetical protein